MRILHLRNCMILQKKKLIITGTCLNEMKPYYFDYENTPDLKILDSILISVCVPILFTPRKHDNKLFVDGGLTSNYPIEYFSDDINNTIGIMICDTNTNNIDSLTNYLYTIFKCPFKKITQLVYELYKENTIIIENDVNFINFSIEYNKKINMIDTGYEKTKFFLENKDIIN